jgi:TetR/AcrR family transcriptional repressor of nem operon
MTDTKTKILDLAEHLTQLKGFNGFSYLDLAAEIGVKNSSIHYHFKAKADLAVALIMRIRQNHGKAFMGIDQQFSDPKERLRMLVEHFKNYIKEDKICMCGMMAAEFDSVSPDAKKHLALYFRDVQTWIAKQLTELNYKDPQSSALQFFAALEGTLLMARLEEDPNVVDRALKNFF